MSTQFGMRIWRNLSWCYSANELAVWRGGRLRSTTQRRRKMFLLRRFVSIATLFFVALLFTNPALHAQLSTLATITGIVTDPSGAVVAGASVTFTDDATKVEIKTESNGSGSYVSPGLTVSTYSVTIAKAGFKTRSEEHTSELQSLRHLVC